MMYGFSKYHGAGNDFLLADNRDGHLSLSPTMIRHLCDRHVGFGADGVMLLENSDLADFRMVFHNPDGSGGMMCGNGGRCIVSFAADREYPRTMAILFLRLRTGFIMRKSLLPPGRQLRKE